MKINLILAIAVGLTVAINATAQESKKDSTIVLNDVVVKASLPQIKNDGAVSTVRIKGSILSKMGNVSDMLSNTPGLHNGSSGIEVNGFGKPIIIMNGREIKNDEVLRMIQANTVKEVIINKSPSTSHPTDVLS